MVSTKNTKTEETASIIEAAKAVCDKTPNIDILVVGFAIIIDDNHKTVTEISKKIEAVLEPYQYKTTTTHKTDTIMRGVGMPSMVYGLSGGIAGASIMTLKKGFESDED